MSLIDCFLYSGLKEGALVIRRASSFGFMITRGFASESVSIRLKGYPQAEVVVSREKASAFKAWMDR